MHVGDKDAGDLANFQVTAKELMLGAFATVKQPHFCTLGQAQRNAGDIARSRGNAGACTEKSNLQKIVNEGSS